jgi:mono/diheme cytochrome c family protein
MTNTRVQIEIILGIILIAATATILIIIGLNEENRMQRFAMAQSAQSIEVGAELYEINCSTCHGLRGEGIPGLCPPLNDEYFFNERLADIGWSGTQTDFIISTISSGRVVSTRPDQYFGGGRPAMPAWSEHYGGPLRDDQIQVIAAFVMNWEATAGDVVTQPTLPDDPVGEDITIELPEGNPSRGEALANSEGCVACHISTPTGPAWGATATEPGIGERAALRIQQPDYTGDATTAEQYLFESIVLPNIHIVEGFAPIMPNTYSQTLTEQDVADMIEYLMTAFD